MKKKNTEVLCLTKDVQGLSTVIYEILLRIFKKDLNERGISVTMSQKTVVKISIPPNY